MTTRNILACLLLINSMAACKKQDAPPAASQLTYAGASDALSEGRYDMQVHQAGNYSCFVGGQYFTLVPFGETASTNTDVYNHQSGMWSRFGLSVRRNFYTAGVLNDKLVAAGGFTSNYAYSAVVDIFNLATGQITSGSLSAARSHLAAAGAGNKMLFAGGNTSASIFNTVDIYNTETSQWTTDTLSQARALLTGAASGSKIVFAGGIARNGNTTYLSDRADIYDVQTGKWTRATLSQARQGMSPVVAGDKIFFAGGATANGNSENVDVFDVKANKWTVFPLTGNTLSRIGVATNGSQVFFTSGSNYNFTRLHIYELATGTVNVVPLPAPQRGSSIAAAGTKVLMAVGVNSDTVTQKMLVYDLITKNFDATGYTLSEKRANTTMAAAGNKLFVAGGVWDGKNAANQREIINYKKVSVFELK